MSGTRTHGVKREHRLFNHMRPLKSISKSSSVLFTQSIVNMLAQIFKIVEFDYFTLSKCIHKYLLNKRNLNKLNDEYFKEVVKEMLIRFSHSVYTYEV